MKGMEPFCCDWVDEDPAGQHTLIGGKVISVKKNCTKTTEVAIAKEENGAQEGSWWIDEVATWFFIGGGGAVVTLVAKYPARG